MPIGPIRPTVINLEDRTTPSVTAVSPDGHSFAAETQLGQVVVSRFNADGSLDPSFGIGGHAAVPFGGAAEAAAIALGSGGSVLVGATQFDNATADSDFAIARLTSSGGLDSSFGTAGIATVGFTTATGEPTADVLGDLKLDRAGRAIVAGLGANGLAAARFTTSGSLDLSFGVGGRLTAASVGFPIALTVASDGGIQAVGKTATAVLVLPAVVPPTVPPIVSPPLQSPPIVSSPPSIPLPPISPPSPPIVIAPPSIPLLTNLPTAIARLVTPPLPVLVGGLPNGTARVLGSGETLDFFPGFAGEVRTATADVTGDGVADFIGGAGPGGGPRVVVIDGRTHERVADFFAFEASFTGGVFVAAADLDGDGRAEIVVTPDRGGGPVVAIFNADGTERRRFLGIQDESFRGGARVALGDVNADGTPDVLVSAGFLGGPRIALFDGRTLGNPEPTRLVPDFFAFEDSVRNGAFVALGDVDGDGFADLAFGGGPTGAPRVRVLSGRSLLAGTPAASLADFFAGDSQDRGGARVAIRGSDLFVGSGDGEPGSVRVYNSSTLRSGNLANPDRQLDPFAGTILNGGVFVG